MGKKIELCTEQALLLCRLHDIALEVAGSEKKAKRFLLKQIDLMFNTNAA